MAIVVNKVKQKVEGRLQVIAQDVGITFSSKDTSDGKVNFVQNSWLELEGPVLSQAALNKYAEAIIKECARVALKHEMSDTSLDAVDTVLINHFGI